VTPSGFKSTQLVAGYAVTKRIGAGGYGEVWRAEAPGGLPKAVKFVYGRLDDGRAVAELKALHRIKEVRHPFLLSLERIDVVEGQLIIVTELADGSLKDRYDECRAAGMPGIPREELLANLRDAAEALDFISRQHSLQHLDIKPENLLLVAGRVKVADFGLVKDLHDDALSQMAGLTPLYAAPELFDSQPTPFSDQYSLAIVYQEMLTGTLPFPGRTAAQLANQHLNARPRLLELPPEDQAAVARALEKDAHSRHPSCVAFIDALIRQTGAHPGGDTGSRPSARVAGDTAVPRNAECATLICDPLAPQHLSLEADVLPPEIAPLEETPAVELPNLPEAPAVLTPRPPIAEALLQRPVRPALFLGVGGMAGDVLSRLQIRLAARFGDLRKLPCMRFVWVDTDSRALSAVTRTAEPSLGEREVVLLPLRRPIDYSKQASKFLQWIHRRWLYNIPRSQQTEGLRPLGRLALLDRAALVQQRLRTLLQEISAAGACAASAEAAGTAVEGPPQVFLVAATSGGTGSGMALDLGPMLGDALAELGMPTDDLCGLLLHANAGRGETRQLALADTYATLTELRHYMREAAAKAQTGSAPPRPFAQTYVADLGDELSDAALSDAAQCVADYLCLNVAPTSAGFFDACRLPPHAPENAGCAPRVRTFGVRRVNWERDDIHAAMQAALPRLLATGGGQRLLLVGRRGVAARLSREPDLLAPTVLPSLVDDERLPAGICWEGDEVSLSRAAQAIAQQHPDAVTLAGHLLSRIDVPFSPLPVA